MHKLCSLEVVLCTLLDSHVRPRADEWGWELVRYPKAGPGNDGRNEGEDRKRVDGDGQHDDHGLVEGGEQTVA